MDDEQPFRMEPTRWVHYFDVPPWLIYDEPKPRFAWLRWKLRRVWPV